MAFGTGRIGEIINYLEATYARRIIDLPAEVKLAALCESMQISSESLDRLIIENSPVLRTVKGHVFESYFDTLVRLNGYEITEIGGDDSIDRRIGSITLQLKTFTQAGTRGDWVQFKTHKTHGAKSESESMDYYHRVDQFADFLIGLVSYEPLRVLVLEQSELPRHPLSTEHILSPFRLDWTTHPSLNAFERLGLHLNRASSAQPNLGNECLPLTSRHLNISSDIILNTILNRSNFRIWDMCIRGFIRETVFEESLRRNSICSYPPGTVRSHRADKADHAVLMDSEHRFIQMKGVSTNNCEFFCSDPILATETQLTRGRVNDHETQSRLYLQTDFDFLVFGIDPPVVSLCRQAMGLDKKLEWEFYLIPTEALEVHHVMSHRLKSLQKFKYSELQRYKIVEWQDVFASDIVSA